MDCLDANECGGMTAPPHFFEKRSGKTQHVSEVLTELFEHLKNGNKERK
jgi:hypothetical protein